MFDPTYLILVMLPTVVLSGLAQWYLKSTYSKWGATENSSRLSGELVGRRIIHNAGLSGVTLRHVPGDLTDHYDPKNNTVGMSQGVGTPTTVAAMAIVAHELGHAQQYAEGSSMIAARGFLLPAVAISPQISYGLIMAGLVMNSSGIAWLGVLFFGVTVAFMALTLPIEIDASKRGMALLESSGLMVTDEDRRGSRAVLTAAALTYVAAAVTALLQLLYYAMIVMRSTRRN